MQAHPLIFDARDGQSALIGPVLLGIVALGGGAAIRQLSRSWRFRGDDPAMSMMAGTLGAIVIIGVLVFASLPFFLALRAGLAFAHRDFVETEGCVTDFARVVHHDDHDVTDMYFRLKVKHFHFNSSPWLPGFHDEDDLIKPGEGLRITTVGDTVLRIERATGVCPAKV